VTTSPEQQKRPSYLGIASVVLALLSPLLFLVCFVGAATALFSSTSGDFFRHMGGGALSFSTALFWLGLALSPIMLLLAWLLGIAGLIQQGVNKAAAMAGTFIATVEWVVCAPIIFRFMG